jgi:NAD(P)-dependent dehydrogenase (short-subunit alcohol dehydrogenase family)
MEEIAGKVVIVTGGTRGIGRAIAERMLSDGARVAICSRSRESVDSTVAALEASGAKRVFGAQADVTRPEDVKRFFQQVDQAFGGTDILVNNAGEAVFRKVGEMSIEDWRRNIDLNLNGVFYCSREALDRFRSRGGGFIVNISSLAGKNAFSGGAGYNASKFGVNGFSEALMLDHRHDNVRVSYVMPGTVDTEFTDPARRSGNNSWKIAPEDVAEVVSMLVKMPARTMVSRVEMRPSRPVK